MKTEIQNLLVFGDSLTDRGTMAKSALVAFSGLIGHSPHGRFTNGYVWLDYFIQHLATNKPAALIMPITPQKKGFFSVNTDEYVGTKTSPIFARTYCEGGLTAYDYSHEIRPGKFFLNMTAQALKTLHRMRREALRDDQFMNFEEKEKKNTLVIEWSGANDLITINNTPTKHAAERAVTARMEHVNAMMQQGYCHFVLFNLPDLSLTPRYQNGNADLRELAHASVLHFNQRLSDEITKLQHRYLGSTYTFSLFDANQLFVEAYENPEHFNLDQDKKHTPFLHSSAFKDDDPKTTADGYMFWDEVHPTEAVHVHLANAFHEQIFSKNYMFSMTEQPLVRQFQLAYGMVWEDEKERVYGCFRRSRIKYLAPEITLDDIMQHGLFERGYRTKRVIQSLGWLEQDPSDCLPAPHG